MKEVFRPPRVLLSADFDFQPPRAQRSGSTLGTVVTHLRGSIVVSISASHAEDPGSIPGCGVLTPSAKDADYQALGKACLPALLICNHFPPFLVFPPTCLSDLHLLPVPASPDLLLPLPFSHNASHLLPPSAPLTCFADLRLLRAAPICAPYLPPLAAPPTFLFCLQPSPASPFRADPEV